MDQKGKAASGGTAIFSLFPDPPVNHGLIEDYNKYISVIAVP